MNITLVAGCDWQAVYVDGKLVLQDYKVNLEDVMTLLIRDYQGKVSSFYKVIPDPDWDIERSYLCTYPDSLLDVKVLAEF